MTRERLCGWLSSVGIQALALGALGISPLLTYEDLPEPERATLPRGYVRVIETPRAPVSPRAPEAGRGGLKRTHVFSGIVSSTIALDDVLPETGSFDEDGEGVPSGVQIGIPDYAGDWPSVETREAAEPSGPVRVGGSVTAPKKTRHVNPTYPPIAAAARVQGTVVLEARIDERGEVVNLRVLVSIPLLDAAALDAVRQWRYEPTLLNGSPVPVLMSVSVRFELGR
jgi:protein TonB